MTKRGSFKPYTSICGGAFAKDKQPSLLLLLVKGLEQFFFQIMLAAGISLSEEDFDRPAEFVCPVDKRLEINSSQHHRLICVADGEEHDSC